MAVPQGAAIFVFLVFIYRTLPFKRNKTRPRRIKSGIDAEQYSEPPMLQTAILPATTAGPATDEMTELVHSAQNGNGEAFARLVELHQKRVFRVAYSILRSWEDAEDAVQDIFIKVYEHLRGFQGKSSFATWITRIAVNESLMQVRSRKRSKAVSLDEPVQQGEREVTFDVADLGLNPEEMANTGELRAILSKALDEL